MTIGLEVFSSIAAALAILTKVYENVIDNIENHSEKSKFLLMRLRWDLRVVQDLQESFKTAEPSGMSEEDQSLWKDSIEFLDYLAVRLKKIQNRIAAADVSKEGKIKWRLLHLHGSAKYGALAQELLDWTDRFDFRLVELPWKVRLKINVEPNEAQAYRALPCLVAQRHVDRFHNLEKAAKKQSLDGMLIPDLSEFNVTALPPRHAPVTFRDKDVILTYINPPPILLRENNADDLRNFQISVSEMCWILNKCEPEATGILRAIGYLEDKKEESRRFGIVYHLPEGTVTQVAGQSPAVPTTLEKMLSWSTLRRDGRTAIAKPSHPLEQRFELATKLATSVLLLHAIGWIHKVIRPSNILILQPATYPEERRFPFSIGKPYLAGMEVAKVAAELSDPSAREREIYWNLDIYQHPDRINFKNPEKVPDYGMAHDIYSLGVVLLEIGLWQPIATYQKEFDVNHPESWKEKLIAICKGNVIIQMGKAYAQVVERCLKCGENKSSLASESYARDVFEKLEALSTATRGDML